MRTCAPGVVVGMFGASEVEVLVCNVPWERDPAGGWIPGFEVDGPFGPARWSHTYAGWYRPGNRGRFLERPRRAYAAERKVDRLGPRQRAALAEALDVFSRALEGLVFETRRHGARLVLVTQPLAPPGPDWAPFFHGAPGRGILASPAL